MHLDGLCYSVAAVPQRSSRSGDGDGMNTAEIFRNGEMGLESPVSGDLRSSQDLRAVGEPFSSKAITILDDPAARDGLPDQIDHSVWRQTFRGRVDLGAHDRFGGFRGRELQWFQPGRVFFLRRGLSALGLSASGCGNGGAACGCRHGCNQRDGIENLELRIQNSCTHSKFQIPNSEFFTRRWSIATLGPRTV